MRTVIKIVCASFILAFFGASAHAAPIITFDYESATDGSNLTTPVAGATVIDFNDGAMPAGYSGAGQIVEGSVAGQYAAPAGNTTKYLTVTGTHTIETGPYNYFGLYWGSIDTYNALSFYANGSLIATVTGTDVIDAGATFGDWFQAGANRYVNFFFGDTYFDQIVMHSGQPAFESDNHAFARVPEPGTLGLLGLALLAAGTLRRSSRPGC